ncbi:hypothetical protein MAR_015536 [Mya arenaria]|uniref:Uncharacterized protein n=1 Tax=Mya arenaria TaxID=6604 RepID=A0ABY7FHG5_MYAAR|nr:hypothetical protein MAR_015536 [Mya arenaria]
MLVDMLVSVNEGLKPLHTGLTRNRQRWQELALLHKEGFKKCINKKSKKPRSGQIKDMHSFVT